MTQDLKHKDQNLSQPKVSQKSGKRKLSKKTKQNKKFLFIYLSLPFYLFIFIINAAFSYLTNIFWLNKK